MTGFSGRDGHYGAWRALAAAPAMGSLLLLGVLLAGLGPWQGPALLGWPVCGLALLSGRGERLAVRLGCGLRPPGRAERDALGPVWRAALRRCALDPAEVVLYVQRCPGPNAYAAGRRSVAVTTGALRIFLARRITDEDMEALLAHELGHHATHGACFGLLAGWLAAPWRLAASLLPAFAAVVGARRQRVLLIPAAVATLGIAIARAAARGQESTVVILGTLAVAGVGAPLADAAVSRASERAADRYAAAVGVAVPLARALRAISGPPRQAGIARRLLARHPPAGARVDALLAAEVTNLDLAAPLR